VCWIEPRLRSWGRFDEELGWHPQIFAQEDTTKKQENKNCILSKQIGSFIDVGMKQISIIIPVDNTVGFWNSPHVPCPLPAKKGHSNAGLFRYSGIRFTKLKPLLS
jgi:hypothetical protein